MYLPDSERSTWKKNEKKVILEDIIILCTPSGGDSVVKDFFQTKKIISRILMKNYPF